MKKVQIFGDLMHGFEEAIKYRRGQKANVRVSQFMMAADPLRPTRFPGSGKGPAAAGQKDVSRADREVARRHVSMKKKSSHRSPFKQG